MFKIKSKFTTGLLLAFAFISNAFNSNAFAEQANPEVNTEVNSGVNPYKVLDFELTEIAKINNLYIPLKFATKEEIKTHPNFKCLYVIDKPMQIIINRDWFESLDSKLKKLTIQYAAFSLKSLEDLTPDTKLLSALNFLISNIMIAAHTTLYKKMPAASAKKRILSHCALAIGSSLALNPVITRMVNLINEYNNMHYVKEFWQIFMKENNYTAEEIAQYLEILEKESEGYKIKKDYFYKVFNPNLSQEAPTPIIIDSQEAPAPNRVDSQEIPAVPADTQVIQDKDQNIAEQNNINLDNTNLVSSDYILETQETLPADNLEIVLFSDKQTGTQDIVIVQEEPERNN